MGQSLTGQSIRKKFQNGFTVWIGWIVGRSLELWHHLFPAPEESLCGRDASLEATIRLIAILCPLHGAATTRTLPYFPT
jgi:hypothetical protein